MKNKITTGLLGLFFIISSFGQTTKPTEYLGVAGPVSFDGNSYNLTWTSHPADNYYKQEYLLKGDTIETFKKLIMLEVITGKLKLKEIVALKVAELKKMKASNPIAQYEIFEKKEEIILDFLISENTPDGKLVSLVERNVYRYKSITDTNGHQGILLFGVSERSYGNDIDQFFPNFKVHRFDTITSVGAFELPEITIAK